MTTAEFKAKAIVAIKDLMQPEYGADYGMMEEHERAAVRHRNSLLKEIADKIWALEH